LFREEKEGGERGRRGERRVARRKIVRASSPSGSDVAVREWLPKKKKGGHPGKGGEGSLPGREATFTKGQ